MEYLDQSCPSGSALVIVLSPLVTFTYSSFYIQNELADSIVYKITYINENTYTAERKYPAPIEYTIRAIFILFALSIYLIVSYTVSCLIYKAYENIKNK